MEHLRVVPPEEMTQREVERKAKWGERRTRREARANLKKRGRGRAKREG